MPFEPLRFVHACNLGLDHQLADTGPLPEETHTLVQEATFEAFERVVTLCLERRADFLLLSGNSFDQLDHSVRAQSALSGGLHRLADAGIRTFVSPGELDPPIAWRNVSGMPDDVVLFSDPSDEPVAVLRDGRVIAKVGPLRGDYPPAETQHDGAGRRHAFTIAISPDMSGLDATEGNADFGSTAGENATLAESLLPRHLTGCGVDYLALGGSASRTTIVLKAGSAHHPGGTQGLSPTDTGPRGCTLVDVGSGGGIETKFVPTAPVRWERLYLHLNALSTRGHLLERMRAALAQCRPEISEKIWLCQWTIQGSGPLLESLYDEETRDEILDSLGSRGAGEGRLQMVHSICLLPDAQAGEATDFNDRFLHEYFERLAQPEVFSPQSLDEHLSAAALPEAAGSHRLHSLIAELDPDVIAGHAHRLGMTLFGVKPEEGRPHEGNGHTY